VLVDAGSKFEELRGALIHGTARLWNDENAPSHVRAGVAAIRAQHADEIDTPLFKSYAAQETRDTVYVEILPARSEHWDLAASARGTSAGTAG
jgi:hypothetical protein